MFGQSLTQLPQPSRNALNQSVSVFTVRTYFQHRIIAAFIVAFNLCMASAEFGALSVVILKVRLKPTYNLLVDS